jgi:hypothetical protein
MLRVLLSLRWVMFPCCFALSSCMLSILSCTTTYVEMEGECVLQSWELGGVTMRKRMICDLPQPSGDDPEVRDREAMGVNPFPDLLDRNNKADSTDTDLLEKSMGLPNSDQSSVDE